MEGVRYLAIVLQLAHDQAGMYAYSIGKGNNTTSRRHTRSVRYPHLEFRLIYAVVSGRRVCSLLLSWKRRPSHVVYVDDVNNWGFFPFAVRNMVDLMKKRMPEIVDPIEAQR